MGVGIVQLYQLEPCPAGWLPGWLRLIARPGAQAAPWGNANGGSSAAWHEVPVQEPAFV